MGLHLAIRRCRGTLVATGSEDLDWFDSWGFRVEGRSRSRRRFFRKIDPTDVALCTAVAHELGLPVATVATLALMATLLHVRTVPPETRRHFGTELVRFGRAVKRRARRAEELRDKARAIKPPSLNLTFDDVLEAVERQ